MEAFDHLWRALLCYLTASHWWDSVWRFSANQSKMFHLWPYTAESNHGLFQLHIADNWYYWFMHSTPSSSGIFPLTHGRCSLATNLIGGSKRCIEWHTSKRSNSSNSFSTFSPIQSKRGGMLGDKSEHIFTRYFTVLWVDSFGVTSSSVEASCISFNFLSWSNILKGLGTWGTSFKISMKAAGQTKHGS